MYEIVVYFEIIRKWILYNNDNRKCLQYRINNYIFVTKCTHETKRFINPYKENMTEGDKKGW